ncbi:hypothetical protein COCC4DRAFT_23326 [Bipolaris maydis ATCC 48331]|uniref:Uncharacterized protein n=2 Tax=Cochliobolus heterostrophus TaxID=5016 RepID=M2U4P3_COCH5|nr:uncharacterized protein COCC4DRAFT_23326 [Bipolaris maydis ATCC 48331]EMD88706.1 hypothetical protein COCHEDRAFT_1032867 [Bipolaris maydis C5]ENI05577.1 hypothetical protein COCC4DRAFT_23326 [Bipolaris maydis ATCC 48331]KAJ6205639.1 hypothetical protein PSV09DRAFT_1032867 [Bipolaris maydis]
MLLRGGGGGVAAAAETGSSALPSPPGLPWRERTTHPGPPTPPGPGCAPLVGLPEHVALTRRVYRLSHVASHASRLMPHASCHGGDGHAQRGLRAMNRRRCGGRAMCGAVVAAWLHRLAPVVGRGSSVARGSVARRARRHLRTRGERLRRDNTPLHGHPHGEGKILSVPCEALGRTGHGGLPAEATLVFRLRSLCFSLVASSDTGPLRASSPLDLPIAHVPASPGSAPLGTLTRSQHTTKYPPHTSTRSLCLARPASLTTKPTCLLHDAALPLALAHTPITPALLAPPLPVRPVCHSLLAAAVCANNHPSPHQGASITGYLTSAVRWAVKPSSSE